MSPSTVVAHILSNDAPGGTQSTTLEHVRLLSKLGASQVVIFNASPTGDDTLTVRLAESGAEVVYLPFTGSPLRFILQLAAALRTRRVRVVFTHGVGKHLLVALAARAALARKLYAIAGNPTPKDAAIRAKTRRRAWVASPLVTRILAYSEYVRSSIIRELHLAQAQVEVLYHPLDIDLLAEVTGRARSDRMLVGPARIIMVARLDPIKDHHTVIEALALLRETGHDVELLLVGSGELEMTLRAQADGLGLTRAVHLLGSRSDVPELLGQCDVFVYGMTRDEGFGVVLVEAMAAGLPIVCTDAGPAREVLDGGRAGLLVPQRDAQALAESIARLLDDVELRTQLVEIARRLCRQRHGHPVIEAQLCRLVGLQPRMERAR